MTNKTNVAFLGMGDHAVRSHYLYLVEEPRVDIVSVFDPSPAIRERLQELGYQGTFADSEQEVLSEKEVDAVIICTPDQFHAPSLQAAVQAGKHVLVEKPVADTYEKLLTVAKVLQTANEKGLVVTSCHPRRYDPPFVWLKDNLSEFTDRFGKVLDVRFDFFYHKPSKSGLHHGLLIDHINHEIDLINWMFGYDDNLVAHKLFDDEVRYGASGTRSDGICFTFFGSRHLESRVYNEVMRVRFERGEVEVDTSNGVARVSDYDGVSTVQHLICGKTDYEERFLQTNKNFIDSIVEGSDNYLSHQDLMLNTLLGVVLTQQDTVSSDDYRHLLP